MGKTALAVHWAHRAAQRFADGQLFVNLRGFDPTGPALRPADVVRGFLDALGVPATRVPADFPAQTTLYRTLVADRQMLIVLDNARDAEQIRPLLPGSAGCFVLVTSRGRLTGLLAGEDACPLSLDVLAEPEARELLRHRLADPARLAAEPDAVDEIITYCARLPLALTVIAARAATHPEFPLRALAAELRDARHGLDAFDTDGDATTDVRSVFSWSYRLLSDAAARLFRLLSLHPGPDLATTAAASLAATPVAQVRRLLAELSAAHLIGEPVPGRFALHDLLRAYAAELTQAHDPPTRRREAVRRLLDH